MNKYYIATQHQVTGTKALTEKPFTTLETVRANTIADAIKQVDESDNEIGYKVTGYSVLYMTSAFKSIDGRTYNKLVRESEGIFKPITLG